MEAILKKTACWLHQESSGIKLNKNRTMKTLPITIIIFAFLITMLTNNAFAIKNTKEKTVVFAVSMDCNSCVKKIEGSIPYEKGVKDLKVSLDKKEVTVTFRADKTSTEVLIKAFNKLGYDASIPEEKVKDEVSTTKNKMSHK
jgi:mercuric ion binding protein